MLNGVAVIFWALKATILDIKSLAYDVFIYIFFSKSSKLVEMISEYIYKIDKIGN